MAASHSFAIFVTLAKITPVFATLTKSTRGTPPPQHLSNVARANAARAACGGWSSSACRCYILFRGNAMTLAEQIQTDIVVAMKARDDFRLSVLRMVKAAIQLKEVEKIRKLDENESIQLLQTILKQRKESIEQFTKGGRPELAEKETKEAALIEQALPAGES